MHHFTSLADVPDLPGLLAAARAFRAAPHSQPTLGQGKALGLIFFNPSLRTRLSTQRAAQHLGLEVIVMNIGKEGWQLEFADGAVMDGGNAEHVRDAAAVMGRYCDILGVRTFAGLTDRAADYREDLLEAFRRYAGVPLLSLESATRHPLQSLADLMTIEAHRPRPCPRVVLTWAPHPRALPQAVANSFVEWMRASDCELVVTHPPGYELAEAFVGEVAVTHDQDEALAGADFVYAKNWSAYQSYGEVLSQDRSWTLTAEKMALTREARFMHCLPVRRNVVVDDAVIDHPRSLVLELAENRMYAAQAVLAALLATQS